MSIIKKMHKSIVICSHTEIIQVKRNIFELYPTTKVMQRERKEREKIAVCASICKQFKLIYTEQTPEKGQVWGWR